MLDFLQNLFLAFLSLLNDLFIVFLNLSFNLLKKSHLERIDLGCEYIKNLFIDLAINIFQILLNTSRIDSFFHDISFNIFDFVFQCV